MEFSAHDDISAPIDFVYSQVTDFKRFERSIMRRGGDVERLHGGDTATVGTKWRVNFRLRDKDRTVDAELVEVDAPNTLKIEVTSPSIDGTMVVDLISLSKTHTRLSVKAKAVAKTIPGKLLFQSVRFARVKTENKFKMMVKGFAEDVEAKHVR
ncbi:SRPBCC family protein [Octadecabacter sp. 1_MG-2023]|uniref:SRPBCC family protein n=1 Tax=unclassified Octadecabacter TaxID=196158 RepID=UPI001C0A27EB|nr:MULTISPECIES: SRPBCC family protein [unclassified Octadecabacter]MBU2994234.1 SRPBCC family protein [Octadecabacter sp. B2R22]MDO6734477.1 SRPBCC family protein [Octadecabacter sp. 1_MG-2023]